MLINDASHTCVRVFFRLPTIIILFILLGALPLMNASGSTSNVIIVPDDYPSIQSAIDHARPGYTILVKSGVYHENITIDKEIVLRGINSGKGRPIIDGGFKDQVVLIKADGVVFKGFMVTHGGIGILVNGSAGAIIADNLIIYNGRFGVFLDTSRSNVIRNNTLYLNPWAGIFLYKSANNSVVNNNVTSNIWNGIFIQGSNMTMVSGNLVEHSYNGIMLDSASRNNIIINNLIRNNNVGLLIGTKEPSYNKIVDNTFINDGIYVWYHSYLRFSNIVRDNTVNGKPLVLLNKARGVRIDYAGQVVLINCRDIVVENLNLSYTTVGVQLLNTFNARIGNNVLSNDYEGIELEWSSNNVIVNNVVSNSIMWGISLVWDSNHNVVTDNRITGTKSYGALYLHRSSNNELRSNIIVDNYKAGIYLHTCSNNNMIYKNHIASNRMGLLVEYNSNWNIIYENFILKNDIGVNISDSANNVLYLNDFVNKVNAYSSSRRNMWFSTQNMTYSYNGGIYTSSLGNYWSDYVGTDGNGDGIGDEPYKRDNVTDLHPLLSQAGSYNILPRAFFTYAPLKPYEKTLIVFDASGSYDPDGEIKQYLWDFGDGMRASGRIVYHFYDKPGTYYVKLIIVDDRGSKDSVYGEVRVYPSLGLEEVEKLNWTVNRLKENIALMNKTISMLGDAISNANETIALLKEKVNKVNAAIYELNRTINMEMKNSSESRNILENNLENLTIQVREMQRQMINLSRMINDLGDSLSKVSNISRMVSNLKGNIATVNKTLENVLKVRKETGGAPLKVMQDRLNSLGKDISHLKDKSAINLYIAITALSIGIFSVILAALRRRQT